MAAEMVKLTFNGREVETEAGKPIIQLSTELGQEIPHFCYHPGIGADGNCRMCLIEMEGIPKLVLACTLRAAEGMNLTTNSEKVIKAREGVLEFILINHPLDCPICDKGGECPLQENARAHGPAHSRMADGKNLSFKHRAIGEHILFDDERCIRCSRCVRFQRDIVGREEIGFINRGDHILIDLFEDRPLTSGFTGNLADICPVGALTSRDFRFKARPWEMKQVETVCGGCSLHCSASTWWKQDEILRMTAAVDHDVNDWWLCDKGRYGYQIEDSEQGCLMRRQGEQVPVNYADAAAGALALFAEGENGAAVLAGSRCTNEELAALAKLQERLNPALSPFPGRAELAKSLMAIREGDAGLKGLGDLASFERVLLLGSDPEVSHPVLALRLGQQTMERGIGPAVTLVSSGELAPPSSFSRFWNREKIDPAAWIASNGDYFSGDDRLLIVVHENSIREGGIDAVAIKSWLARPGTTRLLVLHEGFNRRGLFLAGAESGQGRPVLEALEAGEVSRLLVFGLDPERDLDDQDRWERALGGVSQLVLQSTRPASLQAAAEIVLARRRAIDLAGSATGSFGHAKRLDTWKPRAGERGSDTDWFASLIETTESATLEVAGRHEG